MLVLVAVLCAPVAIFMANQDGYLARMKTVQTYEEVNERSAMSRPHFWRVAVNMAMAQPMGVGLFNYEAAYDKFDFLDGEYGRRRSVHSSHFQVLAETGFFGMIAWTFNFGCALFLAFRIRRRARLALRPEDAKALVTGANALLASMVAFLVGGSFIALALNDLTWITFGLIAALDRMSLRAMQPETVAQPASTFPLYAPAPAWSAVGTRAV